ncbi:MAG: 3-oxoacyl-ACP reductase [Verrucomicrobiales bacterium]|nr:3-oxoacyl-ACP reductase [Verrucomicrobiales bacterium]
MNSLDLNGKSGIVTGGASGIGFGITQRMLASGAKVAIWDRSVENMNRAEEELNAGDSIRTVQVELTDPSDVKKAADETNEAFGSIEFLVNCAGIAGTNAKVWELEPEQWTSVIDVNLNGVFFCCNAVVPHMLKNKYGRIVNIASIAGKEGNPTASHYSASKAGVIGLTKSLGKELAQEGVIVNTVTPAVIQTPILEQVEQYHIDYMLSKIPMGRFGEVNEAAAMVAWLCSDDCSFTTASVFDLSGGRATY